MALTKLTSGDFTNKKVADLPNVPSESGMTATQLKQYFDNVPINIVGGLNGTTGLNKLIDDLEGEDGASNIGLDSVTGMTADNVQDAVEELKGLCDTAISGNAIAVVQYPTATYNQIATYIADGKIPILKANGLWYPYDHKATISNVNYYFFTRTAKDNRLEADGNLVVPYIYISEANAWGSNSTKIAGFRGDANPLNDGIVKVSYANNGKLQLFTANITETQLASAVNNTHYHNNLSALDDIESVQTTMTGTDSSVPTSKAVLTGLATKQNSLVSGVNIKTINDQSIVGSGNIYITGTQYTGGEGIDVSAQNVISIKSTYHDSTKQDTLVSGTNIKTINGNSIVGNGDLTITGTQYTGGTGINISQANVISLDTNYHDSTKYDASNPNNYSSVSVSDTGTATDEVQYITINGVEKKLAGGGASYTAGTGIDITDNTISIDSNYHDSTKQNTITATTLLLGGIDYVTTAPTEANTTGLKFCVLSSAPATKYDGWIYFIASST